jgi:glycosyltransferase involved in cell wall biosynthesis
VVARLLRLPAESHRRFDEASDKLDELRGLAPVVHQLHQQLAVLDDRIQHLERQVLDTAAATQQVHAGLEGVHVTAAQIAERLAVGELAPVGDGPLVSVLVPCRDRARSLEVALRSVVAQTYARWECVVIDDGSKDDLEAVIDRIGDSRIRLLAGTATGVAAARNIGLAASGGDIITFLDSDNWWLPRRLEAVVGALADGAVWAVDRQLVLGADGGARVRASDKPLDRLDHENFIDVGALAVRDRTLRFDESLPRLSDWELVRRLAAREAPVRIPHVGVVYDERGQERISTRVPFGPSYHQIRRAAIGRPATGLRVLLAEWHFPQLTETYIQADVAGLQALGASVEAWSEEDVQTAYDPGIPVHRGPLADTLDAVAPDLVLSHWIHVGRDHRAELRARGIPHAIRCHGFDHDPQVLDELMLDRGVVVHLFPHLAGRWASHPVVSCDPVAFDPARVRPSSATKDRRLVLRLAAGLLTKDLETFLLAAGRCPDHRFVLVLGRVYMVPERTDELIRRAAELGSPVEILEDLPHDEAAALTERAGIVFHTHGENHPVGMPMSIAEAMATGAYVIARDLPGIADYGRDAVDRYTGSSAEARADHAAALVNATLAWDDARWEAAAQRSLDVAWVHHPADLVVARMLEVWRERLGVRAEG